VVIPLANRRSGGLTIIDTTTISEPEVIDSLRTEDDRGISDREQLADLKDREAEERQALADRAAAEAAEAERKAQAERERLQAEQQKLAEVQKEAAAAANSGSPSAAGKANAAQAQAQATQAQSEKAEAAAEAAEEAREEADALQQEAEEKREEAAEDRAEIAIDRQALEAPPATPPAASPSPGAIPGIQVLVQQVQVNPATLALTGTASPATAAVLLRDGEGYYGLGDVGGAWVVSRYSATFQLQNSSTVALSRGSSLVITETGLLVTGADGLPRLLDKEKLAEVIKK
jgi:multidrug efflux pump subunit AcrA (membrane-fusion protein)